jgi:hypothetical protein
MEPASSKEPSRYPKTSSAYLPGSAYFAAGGGGMCHSIWGDCQAAGFTNISGSDDSDKCSQFWITPPGGTRTQLSPPGTAPKREYDLNSQIQIVAG